MMNTPRLTTAFLEMGSVQFRMTAPVPVDNCFLSEPYREFVSSAPPDVLPAGPAAKDSAALLSHHVVAQKIELIPDLPPLPHGLRRFTDAGPWSILGEGDIRFIVWQGIGDVRPVWYARFSIHCDSAVTVFCGPELVSVRDGERVIRNPFSYPLDQLVSMYLLAERGGILIHSAGLLGAGEGMVCAGQSRAGKSTVSRLWMACGGGCLSDDRIILRPVHDSGNRKWTAFGTPWPGELKVARNAHAPAAVLVFLKNAGDNKPARLSAQAAFERLLPVTSLLWFDPEVLHKGLTACEALAAAVPAYEFGFTRDERAVQSLETLLRDLPAA